MIFARYWEDPRGSLHVIGRILEDLCKILKDPQGSLEILEDSIRILEDP